MHYTVYSGKLAHPCKVSKSTKAKSLYCWSQQELQCGTNQLSVRVQTSSATRDLMHIQQKSFC